MGTLMGHILPGSFFAIFAIWWGFCISIKYFHSHYSTKRPRKLISYHATTTFPCLCCPLPFLRRIPFESYFKLFCISIGIFGEAVTGLSHPYNNELKRKTWSFLEGNAQHITMFFSFGAASFIEILVHAKYNLPKGIEFIANIFAFGVEAFLFHFHLHGQDDVEMHVHKILVYNIGFCILAALWEFNRPNQFLASYCRIAAILLQGVWFYAVGFILYFPSNDSYWRWAPGHKSILMITVLFIWLGFSVCIFLFLQSVLVWLILKRYYGNLIHYSVLKDVEEDEDDVHEGNGKLNNNRSKPLKTNNGNTIVHFDDDDDESDSQVEFEQSPRYSSKI